MYETTIIISFYKKINYLELVLASLENQSFKNFEVIIADDGSDENTVSKLELLINQVTFPTLHVWHEDKGFRKNKILNEAVKASNSDYLIFIDGDCIEHPEFVKEHFENRELKSVLTGRRVNLSEKMTNLLTSGKIKPEYLLKNKAKLIYDGLFGKSFYVEKGFYTKNNFLRNSLNKKKRGLLGCNFSLYKKDLLNINGFDERYEAPSIGEDSDIQFRLELNGIKVKSLNNIAIQYHLYHKLLPRPGKNLDLFEKVKKEKKAFTEFGINHRSN